MNPSHIDLFRAVIKYGGMTKAAAALDVGQPHVSRAIAQLETELGFTLFVRGHGSAVATNEGDIFAREVERTYSGLDHLARVARQIRERGTGALRVACQPSLASRLLPRAIRRLSLECPGISVTVHVPSPDTIWSWTSSGQCDIGLVRPRPGYDSVDAESFLKVNAVCALPRDHRLSRKRSILAHDLANEPLIAGEAGAFQQAIETSFTSAGVTPSYAFTAQYTAARCGLVAEGLGIAIVDPIPALELSNLPVTLRPFRPDIVIDTLLLRPAGKPPGKLSDRLVALLCVERDALLDSMMQKMPR